MGGVGGGQHGRQDFRVPDVAVDDAVLKCRGRLRIELPVTRRATTPVSQRFDKAQALIDLFDRDVDTRWDTRPENLQTVHDTILLRCLDTGLLKSCFVNFIIPLRR